ncbi:hypothetical protein OYT1_ch1583 [Ferriphaselus amnicola]|uniref:Uncharacterized protein n=1 Tax=Ferriphaselus amnicola TaxID=1188319 RepID=A0A2Z6GCG6_9PROT|nr:hypothetical protein OYT1_ch1583 [Ferriphaselus amnicola]
MSRLAYILCLLSAFVAGGLGSAWWHNDIIWLFGFFCAGVILSVLILMGSDERVRTWHYVATIIFLIAVIGWLGAPK